MLGISTSNLRIGGFRGKGIDADATTIYNRIIADGGVSNLSRLNFFVKGLKTIYGDLANVPVCYDAHWIGYKLGSGTGTTAGQAAAKLYSLTVAGDAVQTTAASQPLLLSHNGASSDNYWWGSGVSGNYVSTPNAAANQITGDIEIKVTAKYIFNASYAVFAAKWGAAQSFRFYISPSDRLTVEFGGMTGATSTVAITSLMNHFKLTRNSSNGNILFYYSSEAITTDINSVTWIQLGTTAVGGTGAFTSSTNTVTIGQDGSSNPFTGKIYRATIANSIGGIPVVDFNPATYNASTSQTAWTSATGEVWTINTGTATTGYKGQLVSKTIVMSDGVDDKIVATGVTLANNHTNYCAYKAFVQDGSGNRVIYCNATTNFVNSISAINTNNVFISLSPVIYAAVGTKILTTLGLTTTVFGTNATRNKVNNGTFSSPLTGVYVGGAGLSLFGMPTTHFANSSINTMIVSSSDDNATINTATYNLIRSINENAF